MTRVLFLDDSGKPDPKHPSQAVVIAEFAVDSDRVATLCRRVSGAKARVYPGRGTPHSWEIKSSDYLKPNEWKRAKNRGFVWEIARILGSVGATAYSATIEKSRMHHPMGLHQTMPLQLQALVEHFAVECQALATAGIVISDWSSHQYDQHASRCVASFVASRNLRMHPCVYYGSSLSSEGIQVADLIAAVRRRSVEGDANLTLLDAKFASMAPGHLPSTCNGRAYRNWISLI